MNPIQIIAVILAASTVVLSDGPEIRINSEVDISKAGENREGDHLGVVHGVRSCGGPGHVVEWRLEGCSPDKTCQIPSDGQLRPSELEFIPSRDIDALGVSINLITQDGQVNNIYDRPISDSSVEAGETYILNGAGSASEKMKGQTITFQIILYSVEDNNVEVCAEADFEIV